MKLSELIGWRNYSWWHEEWSVQQSHITPSICLNPPYKRPLSNNQEGMRWRLSQQGTEVYFSRQLRYSQSCLLRTVLHTLCTVMSLYEVLTVSRTMTTIVPGILY